MATKKQKVDWRLSGIAIVCLTVIEIFCIQNGVNGLFRSMIFSLIALIVGIQLPQFKTLTTK